MDRAPNRDQERVINDFSNNIILYASAGTGKTFTVAQKVKKIIEKRLAKPEEILCLTFTIKAAGEMHNDILSYNEQAKDVEVRTIHSFCYQIVKEEAKRVSDNYIEPVICDEVDQEEILAKLVPETAGKTNFRNFVSELKHARVRRHFVSDDEKKDYERTYANTYSELKAKFESAVQLLGGAAQAGMLMREYNTFLRQSNRMDFDDLILEARNFLLDPEICGRWQRRYRFVIVDEMQDTSGLEYDVLRRLFPLARVMMCGDFFQTIYEWRGSKPRTVLDDYRKNFHARAYMLSENYRSTELLSSASFGYLKNTYPEDVGEFCPKDVVIASGVKGEPIRYVECCNYADHAKAEAAFIFRYLLGHPAEDPTKICVMARSNNYIDKLWGYFNRFNKTLPAEKQLHFFSAAQDYRFFKTPIVKDILSFWTLLVNKADALAMERIAEKYIVSVGAGIIRSVRQNNVAGLSLGCFLEEDTYSNGDPYRALLNAVNAENVVVYDTETTGLDLTKDEIIQIAAMKTDKNGNCVQKFMRFIVPAVEIKKDALDTHGYSPEFIKANGGVSAKEALKDFSDFVRGAVLAGHNSAKFDRAIVDRELSECGLPPLDIKGEYDTLALAKLLLPELKRHKLETLCEKFQIVNERAHDAFSDVEATAKVLSRFVQETLQPQSPAREIIVRRYKNRFEPFYRHYLAMRELLSANDLEGLTRCITNTFRIFERYEKEQARDSLEALLHLAKEKQSGKSLEIAIRDLLAEAALAGSKTDVLITKLNKIPVITVHQSKGCEFDTVLLAGVDNFMFPVSSAAEDAKREREEKRVFYVAISRAKRKLIMSYHQNNSQTHPRLPSPYVSKIPQEYIKRYTCDGTKVLPKI